MKSYSTRTDQLPVNAHSRPAPAVQPALERRWEDALAAFDTRTGIGVLGLRGRADTVEEVSELVQSGGVEPVRWYGVWLFVDWLEFSGAELDPSDAKQVAATAAVELEASRRDPYRQLSRVFHLVGRKGPEFRREQTANSHQTTTQEYRPGMDPGQASPLRTVVNLTDE